MKPDFNQIKHLIYDLRLKDSQWKNLLPMLKALSLKKNLLINGTPGDLLFVISGFLIEQQDLGNGELTMIRFFQSPEIFVYPEMVRDSQLCTIEETILMRMDIGNQREIQSVSEDFYKLWEDKKNTAAVQYHKRQEFLSGRKNLRYEKFVKEFPGAAAHLSNRQLAGYLDVNVTYLSTTKNSGRNKKYS